MAEVTTNELAEFQKVHSAFKSRCQDAGVWSVVHDQIRIVKKSGVADWDAKRAIMSVWEGCLLNLENGGRTGDWDFDRMKPKASTDKGAFEVSPIEVTRKLTIFEMLMEHQARQQFLGKASETKDGPIESGGGLMIGEIKIKLKAPNSTVTRRQELQWVVDNLFQYRAYDEAKNMEGKKELLEQAPTPAACSWMAFAASAPNKFMGDLPKLLPEQQGRSETEEASEVHLHKVLNDIEQTVPVVCPNCSSKF